MVVNDNPNKVPTQVVENADVVFFFYNFMNHGIYYKVMNVINNNKHIKWNYLASLNLERVEQDMYYKLIDLK